MSRTHDSHSHCAILLFKITGRPTYIDAVGKHSDVKMVRSTYIDAVGTILLLHKGSISKFVLYIPEYCKVPTADAHINKWMHYVSLNGVKDITVAFQSSYRTYRRPLPLASNIFQCQLRRLSLHNCKAHLPSYCTGFSNLIGLHLLNIRIDGDELDILISGCPLLEKLLMEYYHGPLRVSALKLKTFEAKYCDFNELTMENIPNLRTLYLRGLNSDVLPVQPHRLETFLDLMPNIENITLCEQFFNDHVPLSLTLPTPLKCLRSLTLLALHAKDLVIMPFAFCILRSSPYLETFNLCLCKIYYPLAEDLEANVPFLEEKFSKPCCLNNLVTVKIRNAEVSAEGTWAQMALIKLILASSLALETIYLSADYYLNNNKELKLLPELIECSRASSKAKILYSKDMLDFNNAVMYWNGSVDSSAFNF